MDEFTTLEKLSFLSPSQVKKSLKKLVNKALKNPTKE